MELRCDHGILAGVIDLESHTIEVSCKSRWCGKRPGVTVIHRYNLDTGELISTRQFRELSST